MDRKAAQESVVSEPFNLAAVVSFRPQTGQILKYHRVELLQGRSSLFCAITPRPIVLSLRDGSYRSSILSPKRGEEFAGQQACCNGSEQVARPTAS